MTAKNKHVEPPPGDDSGVADLFAPGDSISQVIRHFEPRPQQAKMASAVFQAINKRTHLTVEAGTGVGKSLAYLVPAAIWAVGNKKKAVVATYTKALQAQLVKKDLPIVKAVLEKLGMKLSYFLLMGSSNYLCLSRLERSERLGPEMFEESEEQRIADALHEWSKTGHSGCRTEIPFAVPHQIWDEVCRDSDVCLGRKCHLKDKCFYRKDVAQAAMSDIIVVNQHLFFAGMPLPTFDTVIFDEAHNLEEVAAGFMGFSLTDRKIKRFLDSVYNPKSGKGFAKRIKRPPSAWLAEIQQAVLDVNFASQTFFQDITEKLGFYGLAGPGSLKPKRVVTPDIVDNCLYQPLLALTVLLSQAISYAHSDQEGAEIKGHLKKCMDLSAQISSFLECKEASHAYWVEVRNLKRHREISLNMAPVDVSEALKKELFGKTFPVILTSATLTVDGSFKMVKAQLGLDKGWELLLDSPFEYDKQAALFIPQDIPDPSDPGAYQEAVIRECFKICSAVEGGVFLLFTSWQSLETAYSVLSAQLSGRPLFRQKDKTPHQLITEFGHAGNGVLFATDTFWQGVDVPGPALSCVVIARLPFISPDSPLEEARKEWMTAKGVNFFNDYSLPKAVVKFRQGFGRLIRAKDDFGAVVVLDPRIQTRRYGTKFTRSIPKCRHISNLKELKDACKPGGVLTADSGGQHI